MLGKLFHIAGSVALTVVAAPLAPVVITTRTAIMVGTVLGAIVSEIDEDAKETEKKIARKDGFEDGIKKGHVYARERYTEQLKKVEQIANYTLAAVALGRAAAYTDGPMKEEELDEVTYFIGDVDKLPFSPKVKEEIQYLLNHALKFEEITTYLNRLSYEDLKNLDQLVTDVVNADDLITKEEDEFIASWHKYLEDAKLHSND